MHDYAHLRCTTKETVWPHPSVFATNVDDTASSAADGTASSAVDGTASSAAGSHVQTACCLVRDSNPRLLIYYCISTASARHNCGGNCNFILTQIRMQFEKNYLIFVKMKYLVCRQIYIM